MLTYPGSGVRKRQLSPYADLKIRTFAYMYVCSTCIHGQLMLLSSSSHPNWKRVVNKISKKNKMTKLQTFPSILF